MITYDNIWYHITITCDIKPGIMLMGKIKENIYIIILSENHMVCYLIDMVSSNWIYRWLWVKTQRYPDGTLSHSWWMDCCPAQIW